MVQKGSNGLSHWVCIAGETIPLFALEMNERI
jgi:hypothetical protein